MNRIGTSLALEAATKTLMNSVRTSNLNLLDCSTPVASEMNNSLLNQSSQQRLDNDLKRAPHEINFEKSPPISS